jgi:2-(1,2-epoxy-1,2-dihydrophenyl)acetyl-CoA isomerase
VAESIVRDLDGGVFRITLNRPDKLNAFANDMRDRLMDALDEAAARAGVRVVVITGAGRGFCAGGDIDHMRGLRGAVDGAEGFHALLDAGRGVITRLAALPVPTIAAVNGVAAGAGINLALACDLRVASDQASFGQTFVKIGLQPDWGGTHHLPRLVGAAKALELSWLGDLIDAEEALRIGLVNRVAPHATFEEAVRDLAGRLAAAPQNAVRAIKRTVRAGAGASLAESLALEEEAQMMLWSSHDVAEGLTAFAERRAAVFAGELIGEAAPSRAARQFE